MFCVERRKAWRMLQSKAGIVNKEYAAQKAILADVDAGKISMDEFLKNAREILNEKVSGGVLAKAYKCTVVRDLSRTLTVTTNRKQRARTARSALVFASAKGSSA
jgi:hypothetical protein